MMLRHVRILLVTLVGVLILVACGGSAAPISDGAADPAPTEATGTSQASDAEDSTMPSELRDITLAMSYIPNVQFAPYYVAVAKGYYADAGLNVSFDYNFENDVVQRAATWPESKIEFATASGASVVLARQQSVPIKTVMTLYQSFPVVFFSKASVDLESAQDLVGKTLGLPGRFGESYYALLAILYTNNLAESDLNIQEIGFTQAQAVLEDNVQVAIGYAMNEPLVLHEQGVEVNVLRVADVFPLSGNGIVVSEKLIEDDPALVRDFVQASLRGLADTLANPDEAFAISLEQVPEAELGNPDFQKQVLLASLPYWQSPLTDQEGIGYTELETWQSTHELLLESDLLATPMDVEAGFTNEFIK